MTGERDPIVESAERLCMTLERIGDALIALDVDTLLETEETLRRLLAAIDREERLEDRAALDSLIPRGCAALLRCRRLGSASPTVARLRLPLHTGIEAYRRDVDNESPRVPCA
jgi:hypothetical protein